MAKISYFIFFQRIKSIIMWFLSHYLANYKEIRPFFKITNDFWCKLDSIKRKQKITYYKFDTLYFRIEFRIFTNCRVYYSI